MNRYHSYINTATKLIGLYQKGEPLHWHLKKYYAANKKMGSKDRKIVTDLCYAFFRLKLLMPSQVDLQEQILLAAFICGKESNAVAVGLHPDWMPSKSLTLSEKLKLFNILSSDHFSFYHQLSSLIDQQHFAINLLYQPKVFLRVRPGHMAIVTEKLLLSEVSFEQISSASISVDQGAKIDQFLKLNKEAVIQDWSSAQVFNDIMPAINQLKMKQNGLLHVWDVCAASGGKSILFHDEYNGKIELTVSDIRENMLVNLTQRLAEAGIKIHRKFSADISKKVPLCSEEQFDVIICDVPCSGSGTWARTPEQYAFYEDDPITEYADLQKKITLNAARFLKEDGWLIYITCSVFATENENNVKQICEMGGLICAQEKYLTGYHQAADTLYCAVLKKRFNPS